MSQTELILKHLKMYGRITLEQAREKPINCERLAARVGDLKNLGHNIITKTITLKSGKRVAEYWLKDNINKRIELSKSWHFAGKCKCEQSFYVVNGRCNVCQTERK